MKKIQEQKAEEKAAVFYYKSLLSFHFRQIQKEAEENKKDKERKCKILVLLQWKDFLYCQRRQRRMEEDA